MMVTFIASLESLTCHKAWPSNVKCNFCVDVLSVQCKKSTLDIIDRSPICRLIAAEELWTLLDALQEPVPEEVHQHLENISSSTTPLMVVGLSLLH